MGFGVALMIEYIFYAAGLILVWWAGLIVGYYLRCRDEPWVDDDVVVDDSERVKI